MNSTNNDKDDHENDDQDAGNDGEGGHEAQASDVLVKAAIALFVGIQ